MAATAFPKGSVVCADIMVFAAPSTAAEIITGRILPSSSKTSRMATSAALALSESTNCFDQQQVGAPGDQAARLLSVGRLHLVERDHTESRDRRHRESLKVTRVSGRALPQRSADAKSRSPPDRPIRGTAAPIAN